jgi:hypothetical protein
MAVINFARREIITKIVYYGAPKAGTTSNVRRLYVDVAGRPQGAMLPFGPSDESEQSLFFEVIPDGLELPGFALRLRLYSLPGGLADRFHQDEVLRDVDAVVFVADARPDCSESNIEALLDLDRLLKDLDTELAELPMVFQVNHTDHDQAVDVDEVVYDLNPYGHPVVAARASEGEGVSQTLSTVLDGVVRRIKSNLAGQPSSLQVHAIHRKEALTPEQIVEGHERAIRLARSESETDVPDQAPWSRSHYDILPTGLTVELSYQPPQLVGMRPVHVLDTRIDRGNVQIDLVMDEGEGAHPTRLRVVLLPPSSASTPTGSGTIPAVPEREEITAAIPDRIEIVKGTPDNRPNLWYGVAGIAGGAVVGLLLGFLIWA